MSVEGTPTHEKKEAKKNAAETRAEGTPQNFEPVPEVAPGASTEQEREEALKNAQAKRVRSGSGTPEAKKGPVAAAHADHGGGHGSGFFGKIGFFFAVMFSALGHITKEMGGSSGGGHAAPKSGGHH